MSLARTVRAMPTMLRVGFSEAVAYRAELLVWILSTSMPFIMLALFSTVASESPMGRLGPRQMSAYFLCTFIVRQLTGSWVAWEMNFDVRQGTLAVRLLRPVHPLWAYGAASIGGLPLRLIASAPVAGVMLWLLGTRELSHDPLIWALFLVSLAGGWLVTFLAGLAIGCTSLFLESSLKLMDIYLILFMVLSGYLIPLELFPHALRAALDWLPFRYAIGLPVELMTGALDRSTALSLVAKQFVQIGALTLLTTVVWRRGVGRFAAYGG